MFGRFFKAKATQEKRKAEMSNLDKAIAYSKSPETKLVEKQLIVGKKCVECYISSVLPNLEFYSVIGKASSDHASKMKLTIMYGGIKFAYDSGKHTLYAYEDATKIVISNKCLSMFIVENKGEDKMYIMVDCNVEEVPFSIYEVVVK